MFWADNFTTAEYVGFADTDAVLLTYIDGRPVVNARSGAHCCDCWAQMPKGTLAATGLLEPMRCMSYFPMIVKTAHLKEIRDFISRHHKMSFNEAFYNFTSSNFYSQFNIFCAYLFHYHRSDYVWDGKNPPPLEGQDGNLSMFTPEMYLPKPRVATHARYRGKNDPKILKYTEVLNVMFQRGYFDEMHKFEYFDMYLPKYNNTPEKLHYQMK
eukprot:gene26069-34674_t